MYISHLYIRSTLSSSISEFRGDKTDGAGFISHVLHKQTDIRLSYSQIVPTVHLASAAVRRSLSAGHPSFRHINTDYSRIPRHCTLVIATITSEIYVMNHNRPLPICRTVSICYGSLKCEIFSCNRCGTQCNITMALAVPLRKKLCCIIFATNLRNSRI